MKKLFLLFVSVLLSLSLALGGAALAESGEDVSSCQFSVDVDLTGMSGTMIFSYVYQMMSDPDAYIGKIVRIAGWYDVFVDTETGMVYTCCFIPDASACCAQGLEFVWGGEHAYPDDYPEAGANLTVTGRFETYLENGWEFVHLADAEVVWE